ncbi:MAG: redox-sensitive transcriptional activator SoxR [Gemmatimonadota bacterium]
MPKPTDQMTIGNMAERSGVATSALRFYEAEGLIFSTRTKGNQRRFARATLRRVAVIRAGQAAGIPLARIREALDELPAERTPNKADWGRLADAWRSDVEARISQLEGLRDKLTSCIGCGCLSISNCALFNVEDRAARRGPGPRYLMGDKPEPS